jgi:hypothetical protein
MKASHTALLGLAMLLPTFCHGQAKCPWINQATASGILGGAVTLTAKVGDHANGVCVFSRQQGAVVLQLRISVDIMTNIHEQFPSYLAQCPPKSSSLRAIGNEAVVCSIQDKGGYAVERVVGRVRDQAFVISVSSSAQDDPSMTQGMRREKANLVAEQVAGFLF